MMSCEVQAECENSTENRYIVIENPVVQFCPAGFLLAVKKSAAALEYTRDWR